MHRDDVTIVVVENNELKEHPYAYQTALNVLDHIIYNHRSKWKYTEKLSNVDILTCETEYALVVKIGIYFNTSVMMSNLPDDASLVGHILDKQEDYYELHDQCFLVKVSDYDDTPNITYRSVNRSEDNFHHDYTPLWVKDGGEEIVFTGKRKRHGADLISNLLRKNKNIKTFTQELRGDKSYIRSHDAGNFLHDVRNRPHKIYPVSTERVYDIDSTKFNKIIGCSNGLQLFEYVHLNTEHIILCDINPESLSFTRKLIYNWDYQISTYKELIDEFHYGHNVHINEKYIRTSPDNYFLDFIEKRSDLFEIFDKIRSGKIQIEFILTDMLDIYKLFYYFTLPNILIYYSNVLSFAQTFYAQSAIDADLLVNKILNEMSEDSLFLGMVPFKGSGVYTKTDIKENPKLRLPWREKFYDNYYKSRIRALQQT